MEGIREMKQAKPYIPHGGVISRVRFEWLRHIVIKRAGYSLCNEVALRYRKKWTGV
jgi:hypothetical protein